MAPDIPVPHTRCTPSVRSDGICLMMVSITQRRVPETNALYSARQTTPAINVLYNNSICYGSLAVGAAAGELNMNVGGKIYHTTK